MSGSLSEMSEWDLLARSAEIDEGMARLKKEEDAAGVTYYEARIAGRTKSIDALERRLTTLSWDQSQLGREKMRLEEELARRRA